MISGVMCPPHETGLIIGGHCLPATVIHQQSNPFLHRDGFCYEQIGAVGELSYGIAGAGNVGKYDHTVRCLKAIGIGLEFACSGPAVESEMAVFDGRHLDVAVLVMALFDEYQPKENAKHTQRAMKANALQGFWNGSLPPIG